MANKRKIEGVTAPPLAPSPEFAKVLRVLKPVDKAVLGHC